MRRSWPAFFDDPLLRFAAIGAGLFALHALVAPAAPESAPATADLPKVVIPAERVAGLAASWEQAWGRAPTSEELAGMVENEVRTEVLAREAAALGLDRDDEFVRQHLRGRMEAIADGRALVAEPTEAELEDFRRANAERYGGGTLLTFRQVALDPARHGPSLAAEAQALLARLQAGEAPEAAGPGDLPDLPARFDAAASGEIASLFGSAFAAEVAALEPGRWAGPVASGFGLHLVRLEERRDTQPAPLAEIREVVREDWLAARTEEERDRFYREIRRRYRVVVEPLPDGPT